MEAETLNANRLPGLLNRLLPAIVPMLMISIGYVDPGKWAAIVEGGARFGFDPMAFMLVFNLAAIFCQYVSARIGVITGRDLAEICRNEYDKWTCMFLGVQTELSVIMLDLNMVFSLVVSPPSAITRIRTCCYLIFITGLVFTRWFDLFCKILGMAHGLNLLFGWDLFTCVFLTAASAVSHLLLATLLDNGKAKIVGLFVAGFVLLSFVLGVLINQPEIPLSMNGILTNLSGESAFTLMSLLGASLVPHNFYLHSSIVQIVGLHGQMPCHRRYAIFYDLMPEDIEAVVMISSLSRLWKAALFIPHSSNPVLF